MASDFENYLLSFHPFSEKELNQIASSVTTRMVSEGSILLEEGTKANQLYFIQKGVLKIASYNTKGNFITQHFLKQRQFCTILHSFKNGTPSNESIIAACSCELVIISKRLLSELYDAIPQLKEVIDNSIQQTLMEKIKLKNSYAGEEAATRYERFLKQQHEVALQVSQSDIASYLGITPQSLSRVRRNLH